MKPRRYLAVAVFCSLAVLAAAQQADRDRTPSSYNVINLGTLAGTNGQGNTINNIGWVMGASTYSSSTANLHATLWAYGLKLDLGSLGGPNSGVEWPVKNTHGLISGIAETSEPQPLGEEWSCAGAFFITQTGRVCRGFVWRWGKLHALPTLGGPNGFAAGANSVGQIVGWAENKYQDATCVAPQVLQFEAVLYQPDGRVQQLPPLSGDADGAATAINNNGDAVGISGICDAAVGALTAEHAVLWHHGTPIYLGSLGGSAWNTPASINDHGDVVGFADLSGDSAANPNFHAFLYTPESGRMTDLGTLPGDVYSEALGINNRRQIVGLSYGAGFSNPRAFLWQNGKMVDLNTLVSADSSLYLIDANDINDQGQISGQACVLSSGACGADLPAFIAIPQYDGKPCRGATARVGAPQSLRQQLQSAKFPGSPITAQR